MPLLSDFSFQVFVKFVLYLPKLFDMYYVIVVTQQNVYKNKIIFRNERLIFDKYLTTIECSTCGE